MVAERETSSPLPSSFTDLMTSLAVIFILLLCASLNNFQQEAQTTRNSMLEEVQKELKSFLAGGIRVTSDPKDPLGLLILVPEDLLAFPFDRADISYAGDTFLRAFIPKLAGAVCSPKFASEINSIVVEGHTDSSGTDEYNWTSAREDRCPLSGRAWQSCPPKAHWTSARPFFASCRQAEGAAPSSRTDPPARKIRP